MRHTKFDGVWVSDFFASDHSLGFIGDPHRGCRFVKKENPNRQTTDATPKFTHTLLIKWAVKVLSAEGIQGCKSELSWPHLALVPGRGLRNNTASEQIATQRRQMGERRRELKLEGPNFDLKPDVMHRLIPIRVNGVTLSHDLGSDTWRFSVQTFTWEVAARFAIVILRDQLTKEFNESYYYPWLRTPEEVVKHQGKPVYGYEEEISKGSSPTPATNPESVAAPEVNLPHVLWLARELSQIPLAELGEMGAILRISVQSVCATLASKGVTVGDIPPVGKLQEREEALAARLAEIEKKEQEVAAALAGINDAKRAAAEEVRAMLPAAQSVLEKERAKLADEKRAIANDRKIVDELMAEVETRNADLEKQVKAFKESKDPEIVRLKGMIADLTLQLSEGGTALAVPATAESGHGGGNGAPRQSWVRRR